VAVAAVPHLQAQMVYLVGQAAARREPERQDQEIPRQQVHLKEIAEDRRLPLHRILAVVVVVVRQP
jgi:hypothetical protein